MDKKTLKSLESQAIEGLTGAARTAAKKAFYEANKAAIRAAHDADAQALEEARTAPEKALVAAAAAKGLRVSMVANVGLMRGSSYDTIVLIGGDTFAAKEVLKAHGAAWNAAQKCWMINGTTAFERALATL